MIQKVLLSLCLLVSFSPLWAQPGKLDQEAMETLRFIRLAETKKRLNLDDSTLLSLNNMLDSYEIRRYELHKRQGEIHRKIVNGYDEAKAKELLRELRQVKREMSENETFLWDEAEKILEPHQALEFFQFYAKFQSEVRRRVRALRDQRGEKKPANQKRRKNKRRRGF